MNAWRAGRHRFADYEGAVDVEADVCVVGAGAGGCAAATALAEAGLRVVVLEEGSHWKPSDFRPSSSFAMRNMYQTRGARSARGNVVMPLPGGRGVGGSTLINSAICFRCPDTVLDEWRDRHGCELVQQDRFSAYFDRIWATLGVTVQSLEVQRLNNIVFRDGAERLGLRGAFLPRSAPGCTGCGICQYGCPSGGKSSVDRTFLVEALATGNVAVFADCHVDGAETAGDGVREVRGHLVDPVTLEPSGRVRVKADAFVISAGPIGTPSFLLANGLTDSAHCGDHLVVHPTLPSMARFPFEIRPWHGVTQGYYVDCWEQGFLLQTYTVTPDQYFLIMPTPSGEDTLSRVRDLAFYGSAGVLVHDQDSRGRVRRTPAGADISYYLGDGDRRRLIDGLRLCAEVYFAAGAEEVLVGRVGSRPVTDPSQIAEQLPYDTPPQHLQVYASHPMGTCRMGGDRERSVVDARGRVWGWSNLHVADASLFPTSLGVNPQVTTMAMGLMVGQAVSGLV